MKLFTLMIFLIGVYSVTSQNQTTGLTRVVPALRRLHDALKQFQSSIDDLAKSINTGKCAPSPSNGGLRKIANALKIVAKVAQQFSTDAQNVIDSTGNINGNVNPAVNDIYKMCSELNNLSKIIRNDAANHDYYRGDFKGVKTGLKNCSKALHRAADVIGRARGLSEIFIVTSVNLTQVNNSISDLRTSISALIQSIKRFRKKCGKTVAALGSLTKSLTDFNEGLEDLNDEF